jgi:hypothetical protein
MLMLPLIATGVAAAAAQSGVSPNPIANLFLSACFDGSAKLDARDAQAASFQQLPSSLRSKLVEPDKAQVWKLRSSETYLYILDYEGADQNPQICGVASNRLAVSPAVDAMAQRIGASVEERPREGAIEWWLPEQGYMALASRLRGYTVLQVNQLSEAQRKEAAPVR